MIGHRADASEARIVLVGPDQRALGAPIDTWTQLDATVTFNTAGTGTFVAPATDSLMAMLEVPRANVHLWFGGRWFCGGPIETPGDLVRKLGPGDQAPPGQVTVGWSTYLAKLAEYVTYPDPTVPSTAQTKTAYTAAGTAGALLHDLVNLNAGPGSAAGRALPLLEVADSSALGLAATVSTGWETLTDCLRTVAKAGGGLGFDILPGVNPDSGARRLLFQVWEPVDRSRTVVFAEELRNLVGLQLTPATPTCTVAIVSSGTGADDSAPTVIEVADDDAVARWGRVEKFVTSMASPDSTVPLADQMQQDGRLALLDGAEQVTVTADVIDTDLVAYGRDYPLGDTVGLKPATRVPIAAQVTSAHLTGSRDDGLQLVPTVGTGDPVVGRAQVRALRALERRMARLEARR